MPCWDACWKSLEPKADHTSSVPASHVVSIIIADCCCTWNIKRHHLLIRFFLPPRVHLSQKSSQYKRKWKRNISFWLRGRKKTMATDFCRLCHQKNFYTLLDQLFYPKRLGMHILSVCLHFVTIASFLKVHCSIKIDCIYILEKTRHLLKVQWSFQKQ